MAIQSDLEMAVIRLEEFRKWADARIKELERTIVKLQEQMNMKRGSPGAPS